ncbi:FG-GAP repeat domain-containing protein [Streptomyces sp. NPDC091272]|uniref:FG-GAP repeat domain-containing protein n=1 Tax=Streptomyces sp. NPDC091272 TaxID=3365981 RepID=UPI00381543D1
MRRLVAVGGTVALLATAGMSLAGPAAAAEEYSFDFFRPEINVQPGDGWAELGIGSSQGIPDGTFVYALSSKPLDDPAWAGGGLPAGLTAEVDEECDASGTLKGVYLCPVDGDHGNPYPRVHAAQNAAHDTKLHYSLVYVPRGASVEAGIKDAQVAATKPVDGTHAVRTVTVKSAEHVGQNTMRFTAPDLPSGGTVTQTLALHAVDRAPLSIQFQAAGGQRPWDWEEPAPEITSTAVTAGATCDHSTGSLADGGGITCEVDKPGDYTLTYTLKAPAGLAAWKIEALATYEVYNFGRGNPETIGQFAVQSERPVRSRYNLLAREADGTMRVYRGSGKAPQVFKADPWQVGGWQGYTALAKLGPLSTEDKGNGIVARDAAGTLWSYGTEIVRDDIGERMKVGGGWNEYSALAGIGDGTGDGNYDLVARTAAGMLYFYEGTRNQAAPFRPRVQIGKGWQEYDALTGLGDATGDGKGDLVARTAAGMLYFYEGTGKAGAPFKPRVQIGKGWQMFSALSGTGDLNDDGRADLVARDKGGVLYFYEGTGNPAAPFRPMVKVGAGWNVFNALL